MKQSKLSFSKKKPSDFLEEQLKKKELEFNFVKEVFDKNNDINKVLTKANLEELNIIPKLKPKSKPLKPKDFLEKIERDQIKREEREKLKLFEKLEAQVVGKKQKLNSLALNSTNTSKLLKTNSNTLNSQSEFTSHKRLIDNIKGQNKTPENWKTNKKLLDDAEFRKTIKTEKIEINCEKTVIIDEGKLDKDFLSGLSLEKRKFFLFKTRELYEFLTSIKLVRYIEIFMEDGIEDMECILEIDVDYFKERSFPPEHQQRIINKVKEIRAKSDSNDNKTDKNVEINLNNNEDIYDEEEQARLFRQAVEEFRINKESAINSFADPDQIFLPVNKQRTCCWNCLKVILSETSIEHYFEEKIIKNKAFCSDSCMTEYKLKIYDKCAQCGKRIEKGVGSCIEDNWFCEDSCLEEYVKAVYGRNLQSESEQEDHDEEGNYQSNEDENENIIDYDPMKDF